MRSRALAESSRPSSLFADQSRPRWLTRLPDSTVTAAFQHLPARELAAIDEELGADVLVCADDDDGARATIGLVESMPGLRGVLAGSLASANAVEALTAVLLNVNITYRSHVSLRLEGLKVPGPTESR